MKGVALKGKWRGLAVAGTAILATLIVAFVAVRGCTLMPWNREQESGKPVSILVTRDFGSETILEEEIRVAKGTSAMEALSKVADVETRYGGGFVSSIEGLRSSPGSSGGNDWFYYANGVLAGVGALDYQVHGGDQIWWDYHAWSPDNFVAAVVGSYPRPFTQGYAGREGVTLVVYSGALQEAARRVSSYLEEKGARVKRAETSAFSAADRKGPVMVIMTFEEATQTNWVREMAENRSAGGAFFSLAQAKPVPLDAGGRPCPLPEEAVAVISATGSGLGDARPVWLVLCKDAGCAEKAADLMTLKSDSLGRKYAVALGESGKVYRLPRPEVSNDRGVH